MNVLIGLLMILMSSPVWAQETSAPGQDRYLTAVADQPESPLANYNAGSVLYHQGKYDEAIEHLQKALLTDDPRTLSDARYNLGSAYYQKAKSLVSKDVESAKDQLKKAAEQFRMIADHDIDAVDNLSQVGKVLKMLDQIQPPPKSSSGAGQSGDKGDQKGGQNNGQQDGQSQNASGQSSPSSMKDGADPSQGDSSDEDSSRSGADASKAGQDLSARQPSASGDQKKSSSSGEESSSQASSSAESDQNASGPQDQHQKDSSASGAGQKQDPKQDQLKNRSARSVGDGQEKSADDKSKSDGSSDQATTSAKDARDVSKRGAKSSSDERGQKADRSYNQQDSGAAGADQTRVVPGDDLKARQARRLLEQYQQTEEPQEMLNFYRPSGDQHGSDKDW